MGMEDRRGREGRRERIDRSINLGLLGSWGFLGCLGRWVRQGYE